jgi:TRAP-type C4-dicarboxylate transport system substrate-binding protein
VQDYVIETNHLPHLLALITNEDFYNDLPDDQKAIIDEAAQIAKDYAREQAVARADDRIATIEENGCQVVEISEELREEMREASSDLYEEIRQAVGDDELFYTYMGQ